MGKNSLTYPMYPPAAVHFTVGALPTLSSVSLVPAVMKPALPGHSIIRYQKDKVRPCLHWSGVVKQELPDTSPKSIHCLSVWFVLTPYPICNIQNVLILLGYRPRICDFIMHWKRQERSPLLQREGPGTKET